MIKQIAVLWRGKLKEAINVSGKMQGWVGPHAACGRMASMCSSQGWVEVVSLLYDLHSI